MKKQLASYPALTLVLGVTVLGCRGREEGSVYDKFQNLPSLSYFIEDRNPNVLRWNNSLDIPFGKTVKLDACTIPTIWKSIKYSDEPQARTILDGYLVDYNLLDIRHDSKHHQLLLLTGGSIWSDDLRNHYIFCYDLAQRKVISQTLVPVDLLSRINIPTPKRPNH